MKIKRCNEYNKLNEDWEDIDLSPNAHIKDMLDGYSKLRGTYDFLEYLDNNGYEICKKSKKPATNADESE